MQTRQVPISALHHTIDAAQPRIALADTNDSENICNKSDTSFGGKGMSLTTDFIGKQTQQSQGLSPRAARLVVLAGLLAFWASFALVLKALL